MSRRGRYSKNNLTGQSGSSRPGGSRGNSSYNDSADGNGSYRQHDSRFNDARSSSSTRGTRFRGGRRPGRNGRSFNDLRNNLRNNHVLSTVSREEETFRVTIPLSDSYTTDYLMKLLKESLDDPNIVFYNFQRVQNSTLFYVVGADNAETLRNLSRRISTNTGQRLVILTSKAPLPCANLDDRVNAAIKIAMSGRYDVNSKVMNLANFAQAEEFKRQGLFITISKANVLRTVVQVISENTPDLVALNLRENKMNFLEALRPLAEKCPSLKALDLSKNKIHVFAEIKNLSNLDLIELVLEGNPFIDDFPSHATYIRAVRKLFKNLRKLDNEDLPSEIGFDLGVPETLPETKGSCIPAENAAFVYQFLEAYYKIYDTENRQSLIQAYHENATFSFSYSKHDNVSLPYDNMSGYKDSHNLLRLKDESFWVKYVKTTNVDIVSFLCKLPNTQHDPDSFKVDVPFCEGTLVTVVVTGMFKETFKANTPSRSFVRTFYISPHLNGFAIINEMLVISNLSTKQAMASKQLTNSSSQSKRNVNSQSDNLMIDVEFNRPSTSNAVNSFGGTSAPLVPQVTPIAPTPVPAVPPAAAAVAGDVLTPEMEAIVFKFMEVTKMNRAFTLKCLKENAFNGDAAYAVFQQLQTMNMIPPEAFIH